MNLKSSFIIVIFFLIVRHELIAQNVYYVDKGNIKASDKNPGTEDRPLLTIKQASLLAQPGDSVKVKAGVYRERIAPARAGTEDKPIVYQAVAGEKVIVKGSEIWDTEWENVAGAVYRGELNDKWFFHEIPAAHNIDQKSFYFNPYLTAMRSAPAGRKLTLGQVFVDWELLLQVDDASDLKKIPGTWMVDADSTGLLVHFPQSKSPGSFQLIEVTTRSRTFAPYRRGLAHIHVDGFIFEHGATNFPSGFWSTTGSPQAGIVSSRGGHHWVIRNCTIRYGQSLGLDIGREGPLDVDGLNQPESDSSGYHLIEDNLISDNGCGGIAGIRSIGTQILHNRIERNNNLDFTAPEIGGIKLHFFIGGRIEGNLIKDNHAYGIWLDNEWDQSRVTRNVILSNEKAGIFMELGYGPILIDNNIIGHTNAYSGYGLYSHDASGVTFVHNLVLFNAGFGLWTHVATDRSKDDPTDNTDERVQIKSSGWKVMNNIFMGNGGSVAFPLESDISQNNVSDYNLVAGGYNRFTFETFAESLDQPFFRIINDKGRSTKTEVISAITQSLMTENQAGVTILKKQKSMIPFLTLKEWRKVTGNDQNSLYPHILRPKLSESIQQVDFYIDDSFTKMSCPVFPDVDFDFHGNAMSKNPKPGPFQDMKAEPGLKDRSKYLEYRGPYNDLRDKKNLNRWYLIPPE